MALRVTLPGGHSLCGAEAGRLCNGKTTGLMSGGFALKKQTGCFRKET